MATGISREDLLRDIRTAFGQVPMFLREIPPPGLNGFWSLMHDFYLAETQIPKKYKELIGLAVSGATHCRYCALFHTEAAKLFGATKAEIAEASLLGGVTMAAGAFLAAQQSDYETFREETHEIVAYVKKQMSSDAPAGAGQPAHV
jgi:AhpD family alkylhydroperoxidase